MSYTQDALAHAREVRQRLQNPINAVVDEGIDLKRVKVVPIYQAESIAVSVPVFSEPAPPETPIDDLTVGQIDDRIRKIQEQILELRKRRFELTGTFLSIKAVQLAVCKYFGISLVDLLSMRRTKDLVYARQISIYLCKSLTLRSYPEIGRRTGDRDHTTALHSVRKIEVRMQSEPSVVRDVQSLRNLLGA